MKKLLWFSSLAAMVCLGYSSSAFGASSLATNGKLTTGQQLTNGGYRLIMQGDGNLVIYNASNAALWATGTNGKGGTQVKLQSDGNLVLRTSSGSSVWSSKTTGTGANQLMLSTKGSLALYQNSTVVKTLFGAPPPNVTYAMAVNNGSGSGSNYQAGQVVPITANAAPSGQVFSTWVVNFGGPVIANVNAESTTVTMPASNVTVTATYKNGNSNSNLKFPIRGAFYYPWFPETWTVDGHHVFYHPLLGYYNSDNSAIVDQHIIDMDYANIDLAIASWWGISKHNEATRIPMLMNRTNSLGSKLKWAFYYEKEGFGNPSTAELKTDLDYAMAKYTSHPSYARINGKPVIFVYNANDSGCSVASRWADATNGKWYVVLKILEGYKSCTDQPDSWHQYGPSSPTHHHAGYSFVISPGFWRANTSKPNLVRDVNRWYQGVRDMVASQEPWQLITTFNEWGEGTAVEPATEWKSDSDYGLYLDALHTNGVK